MSWAAVIAAGGAIIGGVVSSQGAKKAANTAAAGSDAAAAEAARQFDTIRGDTANYRAIGNQALNTLGSVYGYQPAANYFAPSLPSGASPFQPGQIPDGGFGNSGASALLNPWTVTSKLPGAAKILDPAGALFGNLFGNKKGDEKRNLKAFAAESGVMQLPNGMLVLPDGSMFSQDQLQHVAGVWYGATHAPDGNQQDWQNQYNSLISGLQKAPGFGAQGNAGGGLTSDGVPNSAPLSAGPSAAPVGPTGTPGTPNYNAFFQSPDYLFRQGEGMRNIQGSFAASGGAKSGNALRALAEFNSNLASGEYGNWFNRQAALAGIGQTATGQSANAGIATGQMVGNALQNSSNARASGVAGQANAWGNVLGQLGMLGGYYFGGRNSAYGGG